MQTDRATLLIAGKCTGSAVIELHKRLQSRQGESSLAKRIIELSINHDTTIG
jgi:hypothetical protein